MHLTRQRALLHLARQKPLPDSNVQGKDHYKTTYSPGQVSDRDPRQGLGGATLCQLGVWVSFQLGKCLRQVILHHNRNSSKSPREERVSLNLALVLTSAMCDSKPNLQSRQVSHRPCTQLGKIRRQNRTNWQDIRQVNFWQNCLESGSMHEINSLISRQ